MLKASHWWALQAELLKQAIRSLGNPSTFVQGNTTVGGLSSAAGGVQNL